MKARKNDRRVDRTRNALKEALYDLLNEKPYEQITVEEITERANLGRATFYLHYKDKEDLLLEDLVQLVDQLVAQTTDMPLLHWLSEQKDLDQLPDHPRPAVMVFQHAAANADLYRIVLHGEGSIKVAQRLREIIIHAVNDFGRGRVSEGILDVSLHVPLEIIANFYAGSILGLVTWWLEHDMPYSPDQMALYFQRLFYQGLVKALDVEPSPKT